MYHKDKALCNLTANPNLIVLLLIVRTVSWFLPSVLHNDHTDSYSVPAVSHLVIAVLFTALFILFSSDLVMGNSPVSHLILLSHPDHGPFYLDTSYLSYISGRGSSSSQLKLAQSESLVFHTFPGNNTSYSMFPDRFLDS